MIPKLLRTAALAAVITITPAWGAVVSYFDADRAAFNSLTPDVTAITFDERAAYGLFESNFDSNGYLIDGVRFVGIKAADDFVTGIGWPTNDYRDWGTNGVLQGPMYWAGADHRLHIDLPTPVTAISLNLMTWSFVGGAHSGGNVSIEVNGELINSIPTAMWNQTMGASPKAAGVSPTWFGLISDTPFTSLQIRPLEGYLLIDNFAHGLATVAGGNEPPPNPDVTETPELTTMLMIGGGLASLRFVRRLKRA
jgi:hypothetical protein